MKIETKGDNILITEIQFLRMLNAIRTRHFRRITEEDGQKMETAVADKYMATAFFTQGNFTVALICFQNGGHAVGVTKRNGKDRNKPTFARMQALSRAIHYALLSVFHELGIKLLPKEKPKGASETVVLKLDAVQAPDGHVIGLKSKEELADIPKTLAESIIQPLKQEEDIPRTMAGVAESIVYPYGKGG